jgi:hypothetical protein
MTAPENLLLTAALLRDVAGNLFLLVDRERSVRLREEGRLRPPR